MARPRRSGYPRPLPEGTADAARPCRPAEDRRQLRAALAGGLPRQGRGGLSRPPGGRLRRPSAAPGPRPPRAAAASPRRWPRAGLAPGDTVAVVATNTPELYEAHFGVPLAGGVLNAINCRLDARTIAYILDHAEARILITDREFAADRRRRARAAPRRGRWSSTSTTRPRAGGERLGAMDYEAFLATGDPGFAWLRPGRRMGRDRDQLHLRHHRRPEGRRLPPPRRLPERARQHARMGHGPAPDLPLDAADVPLQRLVLPLDDRRQGRHQRLPAQGDRRRRSTTPSPTRASTTSAARRSCSAS